MSLKKKISGAGLCTDNFNKPPVKSAAVKLFYFQVSAEVIQWFGHLQVPTEVCEVFGQLDWLSLIRWALWQDP